MPRIEVIEALIGIGLIDDVDAGQFLVWRNPAMTDRQRRYLDKVRRIED